METTALTGSNFDEIQQICVMLNTFLDWGNKRSTELVRYGYEASLTSCEESSNTGAILDVSSEDAMARITAWNSGDVYLEVINIASEQAIYSKHLCLSAPFEFDFEFREFFAAIGFGPEKKATRP